MKKLLLLFVLCPVICLGQKKEQYPMHTLKLCPSAVLPFPAIQPSFEYGINEHWSVQAEVGYSFIDPEKLSDTILRKPLGLKANIELRYYFGEQRSRFYFGMNAFYRHQRTNTLVAYNPVYDTSLLSKDVFFTTKNIFGIAPVIGFQMVRSHFVVNVFMGGGIQYRNNSNQFREYFPNNGDEYVTLNRHSLWEYENINGKLKERSGIVGAFTVGARLGYAFRRKNI